jgi:aspartyl protease family protein
MNFPAISSRCAAEGRNSTGIRSVPVMSSVTKHVLHEALIWGAAALGALALVYFFDDLRTALDPNASVARQETEAPAEARGVRQSFGGEVRLKADARGHFVFTAAVNDRPATFMADTGATLVVLTYEDAARLGLSPHSLDFSGLAQTANGVARVAPVTLDRLRVEDITVRDIPAVVAEKGALATNLLGMSFLGRLKSFQMQGSELVLTQ